ncbi:MAG: ribonuclease P protein component [Motiliproteus sp.]
MKTDFRFPRSSRLLSAGDYRYVFDGAKVKVSDKHLLILASPNQLSHARVGLVIAKKNVKLAAERNRVKRLFRESFRLSNASLPNLDIVILARKGLGELDNRSLQQLINNSWVRLIKYSRKQLRKTD